ncbi:bleomycin resistance protein [Spongorhabdus nitratireducens]
MSEYWNPMVPELSVTDFNRSFEFYTELLGFSVRNRRENPDFAYLENEQVQIMLEQLHDEAWLTDDVSYPFGRGINFQLELADIEPVYNRLQQAEVPLYRDMNEVWYDTGSMLSGQKEFLVQDPDGYLLRFTQYLGEREKGSGHVAG